MSIYIDKTLQIALQLQIEGQIEYGIMSGDFRDNPKLPSIRELAATLNVSPVTVSKAINTLKDKGFIETIPGKGTFVAEQYNTPKKDHLINDLKQRFLELKKEAHFLNLSASFFLSMLDKNIEANDSNLIKAVYVGNSVRKNREYIKFIQSLLPFAQDFMNLDFDSFTNIKNKDDFHIILTIPHCIGKIKELVKEDTLLFAPYLLPTQGVNIKLMNLKASDKVCVISKFATFIPSIVEAINIYAPSVTNITTATLKSDYKDLLKDCNVLIYSTGCYSVLSKLENLPYNFEYEHLPEVEYVKNILLPEFIKLRYKKN